MLKKISFGKIDYNGCGRRINEVVLEVRLDQTNKGMEFAAVGLIYNAKKTDCLCCGQCLDEIAEYVSDPLFKEIHSFWKKYHLNGMHPGTEEQEQAIEEWKAQGNSYNYSTAVEYLKSINLYEVEYNGKPYRYGSAWLYQPIPEQDLNRIQEIMEN